MDYLDVYANWYPERLGNHFYPVQGAKTFRQKERELLYQTLTNEQQQLIDQHRKYKMRSLFLKNNYLSGTKWQFSELKVNPFFPESLPTGEKLTCQCGRPLKYQFMLVSADHKQTIGLGINHFADHLNVSLEVAREIQKGINEIDIALDQLLWLKKRNVGFPETLWQRYCYAFYRNNQLKRPVKLNMRLLERVSSFRTVSMPIYIADYQEIEQEIRRVDRQAREDRETNFIADQNVYECFQTDFLEDLANEQYFNPATFLAPKLKQLQGFGESLPAAYFQELCQCLRELTYLSPTGQTQRYAQFLATDFGKLLRADLATLILTMYQKYQFQPNFFLAIPKLVRNGLLKQLRQEQLTYADEMATQLAKLPAVFFVTLVQLLTDTQARQETAIIQSYLQAMFPNQHCPFTVETLLTAVDNYQEHGDSSIAFQEIPKALTQRLTPLL